MTILDRNGRNIPPLKLASKDDKATGKPEDYIYMANMKAAARTQVVAVIGERLFQAWWQRRLAKWWRLKPTLAEMDEAIEDCIQYADLWQDNISQYTDAYAERIHNKEAERASKAGIILPTWGEIKDHFPGGQAMFPEAP